MYDEYDYLYDMEAALHNAGYDDAMWGVVDGWLYRKDYMYNQGVNDAEDYLYFKPRCIKEASYGWYVA